MKNRIVEMNLGLVVYIAKTRIRPGYDLAECVSDGNLALIQAVDGFDFARGNRFSTYATWAIRNAFAEHERRFNPRPRSALASQREVPRGARPRCGRARVRSRAEQTPGPGQELARSA